MNELLKATIMEIEKRAEELKEELRKQRDVEQAISLLEKRKEELITSVMTLEQIKVPTDLVKFYIENTGNVWVTKRVATNNDFLELRIGSCWPIQDSSLGLGKGVYRFILLAVKEDVVPDKRTGLFIDDYNRQIAL